MLVLKTSEVQASVGSNPTPSASERAPAKAGALSFAEKTARRVSLQSQTTTTQCGWQPSKAGKLKNILPLGAECRLEGGADFSLFAATIHVDRETPLASFVDRVGGSPWPAAEGCSAVVSERFL